VKRILVHILLLISVAGCSPQARLNRIVRKNPGLLTTTVETVIVKDTVTLTTERTTKDSLFFFQNDTVVIQKNNMTIKYFRDTVTNTEYLYGECDTIRLTEYIETEIEVTKIVAEKRGFWDWLWLVLLAGTIIFLLYIIFIKRRSIDSFVRERI